MLDYEYMLSMHPEERDVECDISDEDIMQLVCTCLKDRVALDAGIEFIQVNDRHFSLEENNTVPFTWDSFRIYQAEKAEIFSRNNCHGEISGRVVMQLARCPYAPIVYKIIEKGRGLYEKKLGHTLSDEQFKNAAFEYCKFNK